jgi:hypothetical protein
MNFEKKHFLILIAVASITLYYYDSKDLPYTDLLPAIGGGAYALNFITNLAK